MGGTVNWEYSHWAPYFCKKSALRASFCTLSNTPTSDTKNRICNQTPVFLPQLETTTDVLISD